MIKINLLSPLDKENLKWEKVNNLAVKNILWVLISQAIFIGAFFSSVEYLKARSEATAARLAEINATEETKEVTSIERAFRQNRSKVASIYEAQMGHVAWTELFNNISALVPAGVRLKDISVVEYQDTGADKALQKRGAPVAAEPAAKETIMDEPVATDIVDSAPAEEAAPGGSRKFKVRISGNAKMRESLLAFEEKLKTSAIFSDLEYDTGNYVKSTDIDFSYTFYVQEKDLLK